MSAGNIINNFQQCSTDMPRINSPQAVYVRGTKYKLEQRLETGTGAEHNYFLCAIRETIFTANIMTGKMNIPVSDLISIFKYLSLKKIGTIVRVYACIASRFDSAYITLSRF